MTKGNRLQGLYFFSVRLTAVHASYLPLTTSGTNSLAMTFIFNISTRFFTMATTLDRFRLVRARAFASRWLVNTATAASLCPKDPVSVGFEEEGEVPLAFFPGFCRRVFSLRTPAVCSALARSLWTFAASIFRLCPTDGSKTQNTLIQNQASGDSRANV